MTKECLTMKLQDTEKEVVCHEGDGITMRLSSSSGEWKSLTEVQELNMCIEFLERISILFEK